MKTRVLAALIAVLLAFPIFAAPVLAATQGSCSTSDTMKVFFYENVIGDTSDGNDILAECGNGRTDESVVAHTLDGYCHAGGWFKNDWEDCPSSMFPYIPSGYLLCIYANKSYSHVSYYYSYSHASSGSRIDLPYRINDGLSSWRFTDTNHPC